MSSVKKGAERGSALDHLEVHACGFADPARGVENLDRHEVARPVEIQNRPRLAVVADGDRLFGRIKATLERRGTRIEDVDAAIAAHALALDGTLVTANLDHMIRVPGLRVEDWNR